METRWIIIHVILFIILLYAIYQTYVTVSGLHTQNSSMFKDVIPNESMTVDGLFLTLAANLSSYDSLVLWPIIYIETYIITYFIYFLFTDLTINNFLLIFFFVLVLLIIVNSITHYYISRKLHQYGMKTIAFLQAKWLRLKYNTKDFILQ